MPTPKNEDIIDTVTTDDSLLLHLLMNAMKKLNVDATGRLRVAAENTITVGSHAVTLASTSVTTSATTSFAGMTVSAYQQLLSQQAFQQGFRRNLVVA